MISILLALFVFRCRYASYRLKLLLFTSLFYISCPSDSLRENYGCCHDKKIAYVLSHYTHPFFVKYHQDWISLLVVKRQ